MSKLQSKQIIIIIILTSLINAFIFYVISQNPHNNEQYWINKYEECKNKNETKLLEDKILKEIEKDLNDKFVWKSDYIKLNDLYDKIYLEYEKQGEVILKYHNYLYKIIESNSKLKYCDYIECKKIEYDLFKTITNIKI